MTLEAENSEQKQRLCPKCKSLLVGRHCLRPGCGWSQRATPVGAEGHAADMHEAQKTEQVETLNDQALLAVLRETGQTVKKLAEWRPTGRSNGQIRGLESLGNLTILATDGVLGIFMPVGQQLRWAVEMEELGESFGFPSWTARLGYEVSHVCHVGAFTGKVAPLYSVQTPKQRGTPSGSKPKESKQKSTRKPVVSLADALEMMEVALAEARKVQQHLGETK